MLKRNSPGRYKFLCLFPYIYEAVDFFPLFFLKEEKNSEENLS